MRRFLVTVGVVVALTVTSVVSTAAEDRVECDRFLAIAEDLYGLSRAVREEPFGEIAEWFETLAKAEKNCAT